MVNIQRIRLLAITSNDQREVITSEFVKVQYTDTESMSVHLISRTLFFTEYKNPSDRIEIYDSVQFCIAIICEKR